MSWQRPTPTSIKDFIDFQTIYDSPLYSNFKMNEYKETKYLIDKCQFGPITIDANCIWCQKHSIFNCQELEEENTGAHVELNIDFAFSNARSAQNCPKGFFNRYFFCSRNSHHQYVINFYFDHTGLTKIGQYPSFEDVSKDKFREYKSVASSEDLSELKKARGLASHGLGVASFVYLRRVFERLISKAEEKNPIDDFNTKRMDEKIKLLQDRLPSALVENSSVYSVLSKGVHELSDDICNKHFEPIMIGILLMLKQAKSIQEEAEQAAALQKALSQAGQDTSTAKS